MREIKFRGMSEGKWYYGLLTFMFGSYAIVDPKDENIVHLVDEKTIGQYTGLKDKNGVEIFESDPIIASWGSRYVGNYKPTSTYKGIVKFGEYEQDGSGGEYSGAKAMGFYGDFHYETDCNKEFKKINNWDYEKEESLLKFDEIEVIGNIYENKELLNND